jgi:phosphodiesterase/alkaline phosphatase D-like protein
VSQASTTRSSGQPQRSGRVLRWVARVWAEIAIVAYLLWEATTPAPVRGEGDYWQRLAALVIVGLLVVGHLITWRWEIQGATVMAVAGAMLAVVTSFRFEDWCATLLVLIAFTTPAVLYWWIWRRDRHHMRVVALAVLLTVLVVGSIGVAAIAQRIAYGPTHPQSTLSALPPAPVVWVWSGAPAPTSAAVVARVRDPQAEVRLAVSTREDLSDPVWFPASQRPADDPGVVRFDVTGLDPGTDHHYAVEVDGALVAERTGRVRTVPDGPASFTFAFGNCARIGSNASAFDRIREADPDLLLHLGDLSYTDLWTDDRSAVRSMYDTQLTTPAMDALVRAVPIAYTWDDHDFGPNDADSTAASGPAAQVVYRQAVPHPDLPAGAGPEAIYQSFTMGRVRFILTDSRSERSPKSAPDDRDKTMFGAAQWEWLLEEFDAAAAAGQVVVLVTSVPWNGDAQAGADDWAGYTTERQRLADAIAEAGLADQLLMLAGDAHMLAIDDGSHTDFSTSLSGGFPLMHAGAFDRHGSFKAGPYSHGSIPGGGHFGLATVTDSGSDVSISLSGRDHTGAELVAYTFTVPNEALAP